MLQWPIRYSVYCVLYIVQCALCTVHLLNRSRSKSVEKLMLQKDDYKNLPPLTLYCSFRFVR